MDGSGGLPDVNPCPISSDAGKLQKRILSQKVFPELYFPTVGMNLSCTCHLVCFTLVEGKRGGGTTELVLMISPQLKHHHHGATVHFYPALLLTMSLFLLEHFVGRRSNVGVHFTS